MAVLPAYVQIGLYIILAVFLTIIAFYTIQRRKDSKALIFSIGLVFQIIWVLSHLFLIMTPLPIKVLFDTIIIISSYFVGTAYFLFSLEYNGFLNYKKHKKFYLCILIYSVCVLIPPILFPYQPWIRATAPWSEPEVFAIIRYGNGIYLNILIGESYLKILGTFILFIRNFFLKSRSKLVKRQSLIITISYILLFFSSIVSFWSSELGIVEQFISFYLLGLILASIFIFIAVFPLRTFEILPAAHNLILDNIGEGYCVFNEKNELLEINEELMKILGVVDKSSIAGKTPQQIFTQYTSLMILALSPKTLSTELRLSSWDKLRYYEISKRVVFRGRRNLGYVLIFHDISERKEHEQDLRASKDEMEQRFQHAQKMDSIGQLAGGISHEFNNILTIILGNAELLEDILRNDREGSTLLREISNAAKNASQMTKRLLTFSRKNIIHPSIVNMNSLLERMESPFQRLIGKDRDVKVETNITPDIGNVFIDVGLMEQILVNLVVNARDAMPLGGSLEISTKPFVITRDIAHLYPEAEQSNYICVQVTDSGVGMTKDIKKHLFEPFFTTKPKGTGTGLGLSMVYGVVKQFHGFIEVDTNPGVGTSFMIYIPEILEDEVKHTSENVAKFIKGNNELIILVEDEEAVRITTHKVLVKLGYQVLSFESGKEAINTLKNGEYEIGLLLTDIVMPGMKGNEVYKELQNYYPNLKVLYASGYTDNVIAQYGVLFKDTNFIAKPFTIESIADKLHEIIHGK